jgi:antitoxin (DNA-binding transcriptional repressor) of toxin-antitoxin stability system
MENQRSRGFVFVSRRRDHCFPVDFKMSVRHICLTMKTATVRDLRNHFPRVAAWIEEGESVDITRSGKVIARLMPATRQPPRKFKMPDVMARLQQTFGDSCYDSSDIARGLDLSRGDLS